MMDLHSASNFSMLTQCLHTLFKRYIINGRIRAPPEFELRDMIPTFQQGAKTNRRALQSKFKSWAKRMTVINGNLVLSSSGKIIIPEERCVDLVMNLHSEDHMTIDKVIAQIQRRYTWTKKNFGMDLDVVMNVIYTKCKSAECRNEIGRNLRTYSRDECSAFSEPLPLFQNSREYLLELEESNPYDWSMVNKFSSVEYPLLRRYLVSKPNTAETLPSPFNAVKNVIPLSASDIRNKIYRKLSLRDTEHFGGNAGKNATNGKFIVTKMNPMRKCHIPKPMKFIQEQTKISGLLPSTIKHYEKHWPSEPVCSRQDEEFHRKSNSKMRSTPSVSTSEGNYKYSTGNDDSSRHSRSLAKSCKKPRNINEFQELLKGAQVDSELYPTILTSSKTQFLSTLGLVPKRICSHRTLSKFGKELRKKRLLEKRRGRFVLERKVLRDRNKINKRSRHQKIKYQSYEDSCGSRLPAFQRAAAAQRTKKSNIGSKLKSVSGQPLRHNAKNYCNSVKQKLLLPGATLKKEPEVIDIASSSDDERRAEQNGLTESINDGQLKTEQKNRIQFSNSVLNNLVGHPSSNLFGYSTDNEDVLRSRMFFGQNFGFESPFGAPNLIINQNTPSNLSMPNGNLPKFQNESICGNSQLQFPFIRPFLVPAVSNSNIAILPASNCPIFKPIRPENSVNNIPYFRNIRPLTKDALNSLSRNSPADESFVLLPQMKLNVSKMESSNTPAQQNQASQASSDYKVFVVNKTPKTTFLLLPPPNQTHSKETRKTIPIIARRHKIAPRIQVSGSLHPNNNDTETKELLERRLNNASFANAHYSGKRKEPKKNIHGEMMRLSNWISKLKSSVTPSTFQRGVEKFSQRLTNQLNVGISLVRDVRNALNELEKKEENAPRNINKTAPDFQVQME